jgi:hypothetical protein
MLVACLGKPDRHWRRRKDLCSGYVVEVEMQESWAVWLCEIATPLEERRRTFPLPSERGIRGAMTDSMAEMEASEALQGRAIASGRLREARKALLPGALPGTSAVDQKKLGITLLLLANSLTGDPERETEYKVLTNFLSNLLGENKRFTGVVLPKWAERSNALARR